jgi:hypothetical protein
MPAWHPFRRFAVFHAEHHRSSSILSSLQTDLWLTSEIEVLIDWRTNSVFHVSFFWSAPLVANPRLI